MAAPEVNAIAAKTVEEASFFSQITPTAWLTIAAIFLAPLFALQIQAILQDRKQKKGRKLRIFKTLMTTRGSTLSSPHVEALNMIDVEFDPNIPQEKLVLDEWKNYLDHLCHFPTDKDSAKIETWTEKCNDHLVDLLYELSRCFGYTFDKVHLKRGIYNPREHGEIDLELRVIRKGLAKILIGDATIPISVILPDDVAAKQVVAQDKLIDYLDGRTAIKVKLEKDE